MLSPRSTPLPTLPCAKANRDAVVTFLIFVGCETSTNYQNSSNVLNEPIKVDTRKKINSNISLETEENKSKGWKNTFKNLHSSLVKGTILSSEYTPVNIKIKKNPMLPRSSKCDNCIIC